MANRLPELDEFHLVDSTNQLSNRSTTIASLSYMNSFPLDSMDTKLVVREKVKRKRKAPKIPWRKPLGMPKRPLSAYNLFFQSERERLIENRGRQTDGDGSTPKTCGIGFANLAKNIASKWKTLDPETKGTFQAQAAKEKLRYKKEIEIWKASEQKAKSSMQSKKLEESLDFDLINPAFTEPLDIPKLGAPPFRRSATEPFSMPVTEELSMQRCATFNSTDGIDNDNIDPFDSVEENDRFTESVKPTNFPLRSQSDSFIELRSSSLKNLHYDEPARKRNKSLTENENLKTNISRFMNELFSDLDEESIQFISSLKSS